ncbi:MAG: hypothetical protein JEZ09_13720 [Salinivirgaceae bacterium]|nr:hypothetical protein [Salinivirgaceae bacterium]
MKTRILITLILSLLIASAGFAETIIKDEKTNYQVDVQLNAENQIVVRYISDSMDKVQVLVLDNEGRILVRKKFYRSGHVKYTFALSNVSAQELLFKVVTQNKTLCAEYVYVSDKGIASIPIPVKLIDSKNARQKELFTETK